MLADAIRDIGFAALVVGDGDALASAHLPMLFVPGAGEGVAMVLEGHVALGNPIWRAAERGGTALAIFQGPHAYIHPGWYPSKQADGRAVPTWNYVVIEARGRLSIERDPAWLRGHLTALTDGHEAGRPEPWALNDAPADYIDRMVRGIVGLRLTIEDLQGVWKMAQHRTETDRAGVGAGLSASEDPNARAIARLMRPV